MKNYKYSYIESNPTIVAAYKEKIGKEMPLVFGEEKFSCKVIDVTDNCITLESPVNLSKEIVKYGKVGRFSVGFSRYDDKLHRDVKPTDFCSQCYRDYCDIEIMPCCGFKICWDFCLDKEPEICPFCKIPINVILKDLVTKEARVELVNVQSSLCPNCKDKKLIPYELLKKLINEDPVLKKVSHVFNEVAKKTMHMGEVPGYPKGFTIALKEDRDDGE